MRLVKAALAFVGLGGISLPVLAIGALGIIAALSGIVWAIDNNGYTRAKSECDTAALRAQIETLKTDLGAANDRLADSARVIGALQVGDVANKSRITALTKELGERPPQSTQPGAKKDANALVDDRCRYTHAGARRMRKQ